MSCTSFASRTSYFTIEGSYIPELRKHYTTCDLAISNLNKDTAKGNNYLHVHHSSNLHPSTYLPVSILHIFRVNIPTLIKNAIISHHQSFSHWTLHISVHFRPAFKQKQLSTVHAFLHVQESSSSTCSGTGLDPSHTNFTTF